MGAWKTDINGALNNVFNKYTNVQQVILQPVVGDHDAASSDSFYDDGTLSAPSYTRPPEYRGHEVPEVLRSGDHARIAAWRRQEAARLTRERRPDLLDGGEG